MSGMAPEERVQRARTAQAAWAARPVSSRCRALKPLRLQVAVQRERIVDTICRETGKPPLDALAGDLLVTLEQMRFYERRANGILKATGIGKPAILFSGAGFRQQYEPHGVVLVFGPSNYPFQLAVVPMATALFAGNAVILKCSERTPRLAAMIEDLCRDAGLPDDLVQVVHDAPESAASYIDACPDLIFFTGSSRNGQAVASRAAEHLIPAVLELGGKDAAIVFADCNLERAVEGVTYGAFSNAGQVCVGIKRLYVEQPLYPNFLALLASRIKTLRINPVQPSAESDMGTLRGDAARSRLASQVEEAVERGAAVHSMNGNFLGDSPILLSNVQADSRLLVEETFGPVLCVTPFVSEGEAIALANASPFALSASVWTSDRKRAQRVATAVDAGSCAVNDCIRNIGNPYACFGGNLRSGHGRYHGPQGLLTFSRVKSVMVSNGARRREINWFPFTPTTYNRLNMILGLRHRTGGWLAVLRRFFLVMLCACVPVALIAQSGGEGHLLIHVSIPEGSQGELAYLVFASPNGFPNDKTKALRHGFVPVSGSVSTIDVGELPAGRYAVSVYQDMNGNHKLDMGILGIPREPVGVSNNPHPGFGPPRFDRALFTMGTSDETISITLVQNK